MRQAPSLKLLFLSTVALCGCADVEQSEVTSDLACPTVDDHALVETDPAIVSDARFGLARVFDHILATTPRENVTLPSRVEMFGQLYAAFAACDDATDPRHYGVKCRPHEAAVVGLDPFTGSADGLHFQPVALVDRFDLAGARDASCGESRIVYWKDRGPVAGRTGFIIEMSTPPVIDHGRRSCAPIAKFWASLSAQPDPAVRAAMLEGFYFDGLPGMPYAPVSARGVGWDGKGQIRANSFVDSDQWYLREVQWKPQCTGHGRARSCVARLVAVDSKNSPSQLLFAGTHPKAAQFQAWFVEHAVPNLAAATDVNQLSLGADPQFDTIESISQPRPDDPTSVIYATAASGDLRARITGKLADLGSPLTADHVLARATATTCAGCHRVAKNADLGGGLVFPNATFVHIDEHGALSAAMVDQFLPHRRELLQGYLCSQPGSHAAGDPDDDETIDHEHPGDASGSRRRPPPPLTSRGSARCGR